MRNIIEDVSTLTTIPLANLNKLISKSLWCICDGVNSSVLNDEQLVELYIGIGKLVIKVEEEQIKYKFIPTKELEESLKKVATLKENPLEKEVEQALVDKIVKTYKDLF